MSDSLFDGLSDGAVDHLALAASTVTRQCAPLGSWLSRAVDQETRRRAGEALPAPELPMLTDEEERTAAMQRIHGYREALRAHLGLRESFVPVEPFSGETRALAAELFNFYSEVGSLITAMATPAGEWH